MKLWAVFVSLGALAIAQPFDPGTLVNQINEGREIGRIWTGLGIPPSMEFQCEGHACQARMVDRDGEPSLDPAAEETRIIHVTRLFRSRFLIFQCSPKCAYLDRVDRDARYAPLPVVSIVVAREHRWLVVTGNIGGGSGARASGAEWYELRDRKLHQILAVPDQGYMTDSDPATTFLMRFVRYAHAENDESLEFAYHVDFGGGRPRIPPYEWGPHFLWDDEWTIVYGRSSPDRAYEYDRRRSTIPANWTADDLAYGPGPNKILPYATDLLLKIAQDSKEPRRPWLKQWIQTAGDSREAQQIRAALKASER